LLLFLPASLAAAATHAGAPCLIADVGHTKTRCCPDFDFNPIFASGKLVSVGFFLIKNAGGHSINKAWIVVYKV
jgi:hypothetical protein